MGGGLGVGESGMWLRSNKSPNDTEVMTHFCTYSQVTAFVRDLCAAGRFTRERVGYSGGNRRCIHPEAV
jgi:hypothetical protein